ncbi:hypothetical protein K7432_017824 [Basidiobolus ranarum]|uniref:Glutathione S-transferase n=1 Tax=Basidiobolus ranarum TaxID=34480 RepID=A0ABR2WCW5_9FUNG
MVLDVTSFQLKADKTELEKSLANPESFRLLYFPINAVCSTSRDILSYGGANFENIYPKDWKKEKFNTPLEALPVLYIKTKDGKDLVLSEVVVIDSFLAKKYNLLGDNDYDEQLIKIFYMSTHYLQERFATACTWSHPSVQAGQFEYFKKNMLPTWIKTHEKHLVENGSNGHYVGNKITLADIRTANAIAHFSQQPDSEEYINLIKKSEPIWKVKEMVESQPEIAAWRASEAYQKLEIASKEFFKDPLKFFN